MELCWTDTDQNGTRLKTFVRISLTRFHPCLFK